MPFVNQIRKHNRIAARMVNRKAGQKARQIGSLTVEAAIVVPVVIISIIATGWLGMLLYQRSLLQSAADIGVQMGAAGWNELPDTENPKLYRRLHDPEKEEKLAAVEEKIKAIIDRNHLLVPVEENINAIVTVSFLSSRLEAAVSQSYKLPIHGLLYMFGLEDSVEISVSSGAVIEDTAETMRNIGFAEDLVSQLEEEYPDLGEISVKIKDILSSLKERMVDFIEVN